MEKIAKAKTTDTIPRVSVAQIFDALRFLHDCTGGRATFEEIRAHLVTTSKRRAPKTPTAMWSAARDVMIELDKLELVTVGTVPRKLSDMDRLREAPCEISDYGMEMARLHMEKAGRAHDAMLILWLSKHLYFCIFTMRVLESPLYIPDVTKMGQLGLVAVKGTVVPAILDNLMNYCTSRLTAIGWPEPKLDVLRSGLTQRITELRKAIEVPEIDAKRLIDIVQDNIVLPAFLEAEGLPFDPVTFQQLIKYAQDFFSAAWTASHPHFSGRVVFPTCEYDVDWPLDRDARASQVIHHGISFAEGKFAQAIRTAYSAIAGTSAGYVSVYAVRALVCIDLQIPLVVFNHCLESLISAGRQGHLTIYTELPFNPPPPGEDYVEAGKRRIGQIKLNYSTGG